MEERIALIERPPVNDLQEARTVLKNVEYSGGHVPYGFTRDRKDPKNLLPDPDSAKVVREIFDAAISGMHIADIARMLNRKGYDTPGTYFRHKHPATKKFHNTSELDCWSYNSVRRVLQQKRYCGLEEGADPGTAGPSDIAVIVSEEEFLKANSIFGKRDVKRKREIDYPLRQKVRCGVCGRAMAFKSKVIRGVDYRYYYCPHAPSQVSDGGCGEFLREEFLNAYVLNAIAKKKGTRKTRRETAVLSRSVVEKLIDKVIVYDPLHIEIVWKSGK